MFHLLTFLVRFCYKSASIIKVKERRETLYCKYTHARTLHTRAYTQYTYTHVRAHSACICADLFLPFVLPDPLLSHLYPTLCSTRLVFRDMCCPVCCPSIHIGLGQGRHAGSFRVGEVEIRYFFLLLPPCRVPGDGCVLSKSLSAPFPGPIRPCVRIVDYPLQSPKP